MRKIIFYLLLLISSVSFGQTTLANKLKITGAIKDNLASRVMVQDSLTGELKWILKSSLGTVKSVTGTSGVTVALGTSTPVIGLGAITPTSTNGVSATTMAYNDATSSIQTQLNGKQPVGTYATGTGTASGTNTGDNAVNTLYSGLVTNATHTGEVTGATALTITNKAVTLAKMDDVATGTVFYRKTASTGTPEVQTLATLKTDLGLTGTNSGDQTTISGNAGTATTLQTGRTIAITGDLAYTSPAFNGSANVTAAGTLATVNANVGSFTNASITVNGKGLVTAASSGPTPQAALSGTGLVRSTAGSITYDTSAYITTVNGTAITPSSTNGVSAATMAFNDATSSIQTQLNGKQPSGTYATGTGTASGTNTGDNAVNTLYSGLVTNATHTGDATGATALTVKGINGTLLSTLGTGILKNTTTTGVPSIAVAADFPTLNQNTTGTASNITGVYGGTITSSQVTTGLGFTPYNATNPSGYTSNTGTVTSVSALTLGTTGTDLSSTVATGTTTPIITLNVPTASATNRGVLSSVDWTTFNNKFTLPSLTTGSVLFSNGSTIAQNNSNFFWDNTNNRLGIGTTSLNQLLSISSSSVGGSTFGLYNTASNADNRNWALKLNANNYGDLGFFVSSSNGGNPESGSIPMLINKSGNVLIGTTTDNGNKLRVNGTSFFDNDMFTYDNGGIFFSGSGTFTSGIFQNATGLVLQAGGSPRLVAKPTGVVNITNLAGTGTRMVIADLNGDLGYQAIPSSGGSTNLSYTASSTNGVVASDTGTDATIPLANATNAGLLDPAGSNILSVLNANTTDKTVWNNGHGGVLSNVSFGSTSLSNNTTGAGNSVFGYSSLVSNSTGSFNTALGASSLATSNGSQNTAVGYSSLALSTASGNTAVGYSSLANNVSGTANAIMGDSSFFGLTSGSNNVGIGASIGKIADGTTNATAIDNSVVIGNLAKVLANSQTNQIVIGYNATGNGSNTTTIGNSSTTDTYLKGVVRGGSFISTQVTPTAKTATATLTIAEILTDITTVTSTTAVTLTLPTGTLTDAGVQSGTLAVNESFEWTIINLGTSSGAVTMAAGTGHTYVGATAVAIGTSATFRTRKTAANTFVTYRI